MIVIVGIANKKSRLRAGIFFACRQGDRAGASAQRFDDLFQLDRIGREQADTFG